MSKGRKRKVAKTVPKDNIRGSNKSVKRNDLNVHSEMFHIMDCVQNNESMHSKFMKQLQELYGKFDHEEFMRQFINMIQTAMEAEEKNEYAHRSLLFCAKLAASYKNDEDTHPILVSIFDWLLTTTSDDPHIRYRLCQFVNFMLGALGSEACLEDNICDKIMAYMIDRLVDMNPNVRLQAILALQRLQVPENPDDPVVKAYLFHMNSDPSPRVRQAVITAIGRNYHTIPYILERLWDVDEKVRRHTYLHMSHYPVKAYKVSQRLTFLEQGLNDRSEMVRKIVTTVFIPQWFESYNKNFIAFISALKLDANREEIDRFRQTTKTALKEMFKKHNTDELVSSVPLNADGEFYKCVPFSELSMEVSLLWLVLVEYLQDKDELDYVLPELSVFCSYVLSYCQTVKADSDKWEHLESQYILLTLMEIIYTFDLGDEIGRENLKKLLDTMLRNHVFEKRIIQVIVKCAEILIESKDERMQYFLDIINDLLGINSNELNDLSSDAVLIDEHLEKLPDKSLKIKFSSLKIKMLELSEQEANFIEKKDYSQAEKVTEKLNAIREEYNSFVKKLEEDTSFPNESRKKAKKVTTEIIIKCLTISFYMIVSENVDSLTPNVLQLYHNFIRRHIESNLMSIRNWALKCGTSFSMLYQQLSKDVYLELHSQFLKTNNTKIWRTSVECIFELIDRYGLSHFEIEDKSNKSKKQHNRQLYNTAEYIDIEEETSSSLGHGSVDVIFMLSHFLDTCEDTRIVNATVMGFCKLILHGHIKNDDIMEKLVLKYFNPATDPETNQLLGVFFENLINRKKQELLQPCILPTVLTVLGAPYDSPLNEIKPETLLKFVIDSTRSEICSSGLNIHNTLAMAFMQEIQNKTANKELKRVLAKEMINLEILSSENTSLQNDLKKCCEVILESDIDLSIKKHISIFKDFLSGVLEKNQNTVEEEEHTNLDEDVKDANENTSKKELNEGEENSQIIIENNTLENGEGKQTKNLEKDNSQNSAGNIALRSHTESEDENIIDKDYANEELQNCKTQQTNKAIKQKQNASDKNINSVLRSMRKRRDSENSLTCSPKIRIEAKFESGSKKQKATQSINEEKTDAKEGISNPTKSIENIPSPQKISMRQRRMLSKPEGQQQPKEKQEKTVVLTRSSERMKSKEKNDQSNQKKEIMNLNISSRISKKETDENGKHLKSRRNLGSSLLAVAARERTRSETYKSQSKIGDNDSSKCPSEIENEIQEEEAHSLSPSSEKKNSVTSERSRKKKREPKTPVLVIKTSERIKQKVELTKSVETKIRQSKYPLVKVSQLNKTVETGYRTRSATKTTNKIDDEKASYRSRSSPRRHFDTEELSNDSNQRTRNNAKQKSKNKKDKVGMKAPSRIPRRI